MAADESHRLLAGRYRLGAVIGRGGMGTVWQARDELLNRDVAVKEIVWPPQMDPAEREVARGRAVREAQLAARLHHPNVVTVYDIVEEDDRPCIVMELVPFRSLREVIAEDGPLSPAQAARIGLSVLAALRAVHEAGVVHRDVKPANILLGPEGRIVLADFGIAKAVDSPALTSSGVLVGSPSYLAPERARGGIAGPAADLWALGASLFAAVEGRPPFERDGVLASLTAVVADELDPAPHAGPLRPVIEGLLDKNPATAPRHSPDRAAAAPGRVRRRRAGRDPRPARPRIHGRSPASRPRPAGRASPARGLRPARRARPARRFRLVRRPPGRPHAGRPPSGGQAPAGRPPPGRATAGRRARSSHGRGPAHRRRGGRAGRRGPRRRLPPPGRASARTARRHHAVDRRVPAVPGRHGVLGRRLGVLRSGVESVTVHPVHVVDASAGQHGDGRRARRVLPVHQLDRLLDRRPARLDHLARRPLRVHQGPRQQRHLPADRPVRPAQARPAGGLAAAGGGPPVQLPRLPPHPAPGGPATRRRRRQRTGSSPTTRTASWSGS